MRTHTLILIVACFGCWLTGGVAAPQEAKGKKGGKAKEVELNPFGRPEGSIVDQPARYYIWYDGDSWQLRTTSQAARNFTGVIRLKNAKFKSCVTVGLKNDKQKKGAEDGWRMSGDRDEIKFAFKTGKLSDGLDIKVDGDDGVIEFDLSIDTQKNPRAIFVGRDVAHPGKNPFTLPATPKKPSP